MPRPRAGCSRACALAYALTWSKVSRCYQILSGCLCPLDWASGQPPRREFPPLRNPSGGVHLSPPLGPGFLFPSVIRRVASGLVDLGSPISGGSSRSKAITVVTVDGDPLARRALGAQLATHRDLDLVGEAPDASTGVDLVSKQHPDLVLIAVTARD